MSEHSLEYIIGSLKNNPKTCAVIDNDDEFLEVIRRILQGYGFLVFGFNDSQEFVDSYDKGQFDIIILDWELLPVSGMEVIEMIRSEGEPYPALIVACDGGESVSFQLALPPIGFLFKPFDTQRLSTMLVKYLET